MTVLSIGGYSSFNTILEHSIHEAEDRLHTALTTFPAKSKSMSRCIYVCFLTVPYKCIPTNRECQCLGYGPNQVGILVMLRKLWREGTNDGLYAWLGPEKCKKFIKSMEYYINAIFNTIRPAMFRSNSYKNGHHFTLYIKKHLIT